jgi:hypothetical protein
MSDLDCITDAELIELAEAFDAAIIRCGTVFEDEFSAEAGDPELFVFELTKKMHAARRSLFSGDVRAAGDVLASMRPYWANFHVGGLQ